MRLAATCALLAGTAFAGASTDPTPAQVDDIIAKFASKEAEFAVARGNYTYRQTARVQSLDADGASTGKWEEVADIVFTRAPGGDCMDAGFREACAGRWSHGSTNHVVSLQPDGQLRLKPDYQPLYHLDPYQGGIFSIRELEGFRVEFRRGATGSVDELVFHQPNGTFIAHRIETDVVSG